MGDHVVTLGIKKPTWLWLNRRPASINERFSRQSYYVFLREGGERPKVSHLLAKELVIFSTDLAHLDLQLGSLPSRVVQRAPGIGQLGLVEGLKAREFTAAHLFPLGDLEVERAVLDLQAADLVDVNGQAVIELPQFLLLLQAGDAGRTKRCAGRTAPGALPYRCGSRHSSRHGANKARGNGVKIKRTAKPETDSIGRLEPREGAQKFTGGKEGRWTQRRLPIPAAQIGLKS